LAGYTYTGTRAPQVEASVGPGNGFSALPDGRTSDPMDTERRGTDLEGVRDECGDLTPTNCGAK
jgi:hypothetical protein